MPAFGYPLDTNMVQLDNYQTTYDSKTKLVIFYSLSNSFDLISGRKYYRYISKYFEITMGLPRLSMGKFILLLHACA